MKLKAYIDAKVGEGSPFTEGRGLKHVRGQKSQKAFGVALHGGAWIETYRVADGDIVCRVALHGGAWIETSSNIETYQGHVVALHGGAWIETRLARLLQRAFCCRPSRRGVD